MTELDFSDPCPDDYEALSRDRIPVRSMRETDVPAIIGLDRRLTGRERSAYYMRKAQEALAESGVRVSLVTELDGRIVGFVMARVDFGEFGETRPEAVLDTIGVDPAYKNRSIATALLSQLLANLGALGVERVRTEVHWDDLGLIAFLRRCGFAPSQRLAAARPIDAPVVR
ncbi:MAG: GNAT family N-acetyltransferase [Rhodospirillales bacterium]|nr:GNAT family N-acetyltransferase [Rhodospirillales bacterium]